MARPRTVTEAEQARRDAWRAVKVALEDGQLPPLETQRCARCGAQSRAYHHDRGYAPEHRLTVQALCGSCHRIVHGDEVRQRHETRRVDRERTQRAAREAWRLARLQAAPKATRPLRRWRIDKGWTQEELAAAAGVTPGTIVEIEAGRRPRPHPSTRKKIADALGTQPSEITEFDGG